jgi:hypothetical protein
MTGLEYLRMKAAVDSQTAPQHVSVVYLDDEEDAYITYYPPDNGEKLLFKFHKGIQIEPNEQIKEEFDKVPTYFQKEYLTEQGVTVRFREYADDTAEISVCRHGVPIITFDSFEALRAFYNNIKHLGWHIEGAVHDGKIRLRAGT